MDSDLQKLKEENENFNKALNNSIWGVLIFDKKGDIKFVNEEFSKMHGYDSKELVELRMVDLFTEKEYGEQFEPALKK